jgi:undecaprenyl diphosphate synthase
MNNEVQAVPRHIAIVMDGNGRWAKARMLPRIFGHRKGVEVVRETVRTCNDLGVKCLTLFAFSSENWKRPKEEVSGLMSLFMTALEKEARSLKKNGVRLEFIGDRSAFPVKLQEKIQQVEHLTAGGENLRMIIAANYGGRWDIMQAAKQWCTKWRTDNTENSSFTNTAKTNYSEKDFSAYLSTAALPELDLFIRTGGEKRISNFLLWQLAYAELYFTDVLWPEFNRDELMRAIEDFSFRQRRFGMTGDQVESKKHA